MASSGQQRGYLGLDEAERRHGRRKLESSQGAVRAFIRCFRRLGFRAWVPRTGRKSFCSLVLPQVDGSGNIIAGGASLSDSVDGATNTGNPNSWDALIAKYSSTGVQQWIIQYGTPSSSQLDECLALEAQGIMGYRGAVSANLQSPNSG